MFVSMRSRPIVLKLRKKEWVAALLSSGPVNARRVNHTLYYMRGLEVAKSIQLFGESDFANFPARSSGWFPNQGSAENYTRGRLALGHTGEDTKHPFAKYPPDNAAPVNI